MEKTQYELYDEADAPLVVEFLKRNKFYLAKFDKNLTAEKYISLQKKRGLLFAVIAKRKSKVIGHVAAYRNGGQKVSYGNQVYVSSMIIDIKYRMSLFTVVELFCKLIEEITDLGFTDIISEVAYNNLASLYLLRKCGFILFNDKPDIYGNYLLHNYIPSMIHMVNNKNILKDESLARYFPPINKREILKKSLMVNDRFFEHDTNSPYGHLKILININSGFIAGVTLINEFKFSLILGQNNTYEIIAYNNITTFVIKCYIIEKLLSEETYELNTGDKKEISLFEEIDKIILYIPEKDIVFYFYPKKISKYDVRDEEIYHLTDHILLNKLSGFLEFYNDSSIKLKEMWPLLEAPFIDGILIPNYEKKIQLKNDETESHIYSLSVDEANYILDRKYILVDDYSVVINTILKMKCYKIIKPIFNFGLCNIDFNCEIVLTNGAIVTRKFNFKHSTLTCTEELIYEDFRNEDYSQIIFSKIRIIFSDSVYEIETDNPARCFCNFNYIGIKFEDIVAKNKNCVHYGNIYINIVHL